MKEDFLHYLWRFKKFESSNLKTCNNEPLSIIDGGRYLQLSGPDFFNATIKLGKQKWAGNIEIHVKSSDWYLHRHQDDPAYENVILHVVWEHDTPVFRKDNSEIPVLVLKDYTSQEIIDSYRQLMEPKSWIFCEPYLLRVDLFTITNWLERLFFERLERKSKAINAILSHNGNDWEAALFCLLAKNFGLNSNGELFFKIATAIPFAVIRKERHDPMRLEALLFGFAGLLTGESEDNYRKTLQETWHYLRQKHNLSPEHFGSPEFFKLRPDNFPTVRLSQLAQLYHGRENLFSALIQTDEVSAWMQVLTCGVSSYWETHYVFDRESPKKTKRITPDFARLVLINTVVPMRFAYAQAFDRDVSDQLLSIMESVPAERNSVTERFSIAGIKAANALESQSMLQLRNEYCENRRCMECEIGNFLMRGLSPKNELNLKKIPTDVTRTPD